MARLRGRSRGEPSRSARPGSCGALSGEAVAESVHPEGGRAAAAARGRALEDKILQRAVVEVLNAIYEQDFLGFSYGFRPGRSPHHALDALAVGIVRKKVNWVLDLDFWVLDLDFRISGSSSPALTINGWRSSLGTGSRTDGSCG